MTDTLKRKPGWKPGQSGNPSGRPSNTFTSIHRLREIVSEEGYIEMINVLKQKALEGDTASANILLSRLTPAMKPAPAPIKVDVQGETPTQRCDSIIGAMVNGDLSIEQGRLLLESIVDLSQLQELERLNARLDKLEAAR